MDLSVINVCQLKTCWGCLYCCFSWCCELCWCRFGSWSFVIKLKFCSDFEHKVWSKFWSWSSGKIWSWSSVSFFLLMFCRMLNPSWILVEILKLGLVKILKLKFYGEADVWSRFWSWCLVEILKMKFDQELCLNLWYEINPRVRCASGDVFISMTYNVNQCKNIKRAT